MTVPPGACNCCTEDIGELIFTGVGAPYPFTLSRQAWCTPDLTSLSVSPKQRPTDNVLIPMASGLLPLPRRMTETEYLLPFFINGVVDESDVIASNEGDQLEKNLRYLYTYVFAPPTPPLATRPAQFVTPGGTTLTAAVQFGENPLVGATDSGLWKGVIHMIIPAGRFA